MTDAVITGRVIRLREPPTIWKTDTNGLQSVKSTDFGVHS